jgi:chromate reductase, NAD(P)H dehydrogenase (quinone)
MSVPTIAVFVGSLRKDSCNRKLAHALEKIAGDRARFQYVQIGDLPLYDQDFDGHYPAQGTRLKDQVRAADAVLFVTPEYNRSVPGVLKNAIDIGSRPYGDSAFAGKSLAFLDMHVLGQPEAFIHFKDGLIDADGSIHNEGTQKFLQGYVDRFLALIAVHVKGD